MIMNLPDELFSIIFNFLQYKELVNLIVFLKIANKKTNNLLNLEKFAIERFGKCLKQRNLYVHCIFDVFINLPTINNYKSYIYYIEKLNYIPYKFRFCNNGCIIKKIVNKWSDALHREKEKKKFKTICRHAHKYICI